MAEVARYAKEKGIEIIGHHETGGNIFNYERQLDNAYKWYADLGVHSVKTGYAGGLPGGHSHHGQFNVRHYRKVVQTAAGYHTTVNAHEPIKDTGIRRTYPNMMTREGARGMEWNGWSEGNPPEHHELLPFTRLLGGPMDYTPGIFDTKLDFMGDLPHGQVQTTLAKQLALYVTLYSPLQMAADLVENYEKHMDAFQFIKDVAVDWDDSKYIEAEPGDYITVARKAKGTGNWFVGGITDENARTANFTLDFLEPGKQYVATLYADGKDADYKENPTSYQIKKGIVTSKTKMSVKEARSVVLH